MAKVTGYADPFLVHAFLRKYAPLLPPFVIGYQIKAKPPLNAPLELMVTLAVDQSVFDELRAEANDGS